MRRSSLVGAVMLALVIGGTTPGEPPVPAGPRGFRMGFTPFPYDFTLEAVADVEKFVHRNADIIAVHFEGVPWAEVLAGKPIHPKFLEDWQRHRKATPPGGKVYLALTPLNNGRNDIAAYRAEKEGLPLPPALAGKALDDPAVVKAYLEYCRRAVEYFKPAYLTVGIEVNELFHHAPAMWPAYVKLHEQVYQALKKEYPRLPVAVSFSLHNLRNPGWADRAAMLAALKKLLVHSDLIAVSFYPFMMGDSSKAAAELAWLGEEFGGLKKPFAIVESGDLAEPLSLDQPRLTLPGSAVGQRRTVAALLQFADSKPCEFVIWFVPRDYDALWEKLRAAGVPAFFAIWKDCGLEDGAGQGRPGLELWQAYVRRSYRAR